MKWQKTITSFVLFVCSTTNFALAELIEFTNKGEIPYQVSACVDAEKNGVELREPWVSIDKKESRTRKTRIEFYYHNESVYAFDKTETQNWSTGWTKYHVQCFKQKRLNKY